MIEGALDMSSPPTLADRWYSLLSQPLRHGTQQPFDLCYLYIYLEISLGLVYSLRQTFRDILCCRQAG